MPNSTSPTQQNEQALRDEIDRLNQLLTKLMTRTELEMGSLRVQLQELTVHDPLTGLYNRHHFDEYLNRELIRAERYNKPISVIMADIDHIKVINETYGHQAGDEVLKAFAALVKRSARASDIVSRYGEEEFLLILSDMNVEDAYKRAEQMRNQFMTSPLVIGSSIIHATASFGIAVFPEHGKTGEELITAADTAVASAKADGRNLVKLYNEKMHPGYIA